MSRAAVVGAALATLAVTACGNRAATNPVPATSVPAAEMRVLAASTIPYLPSTTTVLTTTELGKDAPIPGLAGKIASWGYLDGRERTFQGESRRLTTVISRSLVFRSATGARRYVAFVRAHATQYFGVATGVGSLTSEGRTGWVFSPPPCACHLANPVLVGVLDDGSNVVWLDINGPKATRALLVQLLAQSASAPATVAG
ncbi:MAG TPA: hypothetical protein VEM41_03670 [Actinomycetota bacterium]|nr:hypothetical protein [Actinomycetota bacterium]